MKIAHIHTSLNNGNLELIGQRDGEDVQTRKTRKDQIVCTGNNSVSIEQQHYVNVLIVLQDTSTEYLKKKKYKETSSKNC